MRFTVAGGGEIVLVGRVMVLGNAESGCGGE